MADPLSIDIANETDDRGIAIDKVGVKRIRYPITVLDRAIGDQWLVATGLQQGDRVIVEGMQYVRPGGSVKEVPFDAGEKAGAGSQGRNRADATSN